MTPTLLGRLLSSYNSQQFQQTVYDLIPHLKDYILPNLTVPFSVKSIFPALMSLCIFPWLCKYDKPKSALWHIAAISNSFSGFLWTVNVKQEE